MIKREKYIAEIRGFYDSDLIKVITDVRRWGKSVILEQIKDEISKKSNNTISIDFENRAETRAIETWSDIVTYVKDHRNEGLCYVFLDEIQEIENWAIAVKSFRKENCSVFITGSNSKLLSYASELGKTMTISDYLVWGRFPKQIELSPSDQRRYLNDLDKTIVINDIIRSYNIKKLSDFKKVVSFVLISNSRIYSSRSISAYLKGQGLSVSPNTIQKWISYLREAYVIDQVPRYSTKAKKELEDSKKLYDYDVALNSIWVKDNRFDLTHNMKNIVWMNSYTGVTL